MPVQVEWVDPAETIIRLDISGSWALEEYLKALQQAIALTAGKTYVVHTVIDMTGASNFPTQVLASARGFEARFPLNQGLFIIVSMPLYLRTMIQIAIKTYMKATFSNLLFADTLDESYRLIAEYE